MTSTQYKINCVTDFEKAKELWEQFSPDQEIYDNWNFRYIFYKYYNYPLHFYTASINNEVVGLLPLQYNTDEKYLQFLGGGFMEYNKVFISSLHEQCISLLYQAIDKKANLECIVSDDAKKIDATLMDYTYRSKIIELKSADEFLSRQFIRRDYKRIKKKISKVELLNISIKKNDQSNLELLFDLNKKVFGSESSFHLPHRCDIYRDIFRSNFDGNIFAYEIDGNIEGVSFFVLYNGICYSFNAGVNKEKFPDLGKYITYTKIQYAIEKGITFYDVMLGDLGWKETWNFARTPQYILTK